MSTLKVGDKVVASGFYNPSPILKVENRPSPNRAMPDNVWYLVGKIWYISDAVKPAECDCKENNNENT